ncbi:MAG: hypothetical protein RIR39_549 [Pseudomonadota bacterium]|jgi:hypothetical protein
MSDYKNTVYITKDQKDAVRTSRNLLSLGATSISIKRNREHNAFNIFFTASDSVIQEGRSGVKYTSAEEIFIVTRYLAGLPVGYIASKTHRKFSGIEAKLQKYGIYLLDNRDPDAIGYATFLYKLISLKNIDDSDVETYLPDIYKEIKEKYEFCLDSDDEINSISEFIVGAEFYIEQLRSPEALRPVLAKALHRVLAKALKVCHGFDNTLLAFAHNQFEENMDIKSKLALLRHFDRDDTYFYLLDKIDLGIPLNWTIDLLRNKHTYEKNRYSYSKALVIWDTIVTASLWDLSRDQRSILLTAVTNSEAWLLNIDKVHSLANSGSALASWFLGEILLSEVSQSPDQSVNELSDIVMSCLSGSLLQNKKAYDYITKNVLAFPEQRIDSYLDKLIKAHQQLQDELDEKEEIEDAENESIESAESIIEREEAQEDWGESFDDIDPLYWESYLGGPDDEYWEREEERGQF